jgi:hypothetical protein
MNKKINQRRLIMKSIKKLTLWCAGAALAICSFSSPAKAVTSQNIEIHVSINATKSLSTGATFYNYGALSVNVSSVSSSILVTNNSTSLVETYTLLAGNAISDAAGTNWTLAASTGTNQYALGAQFSSAQPANTPAAWDATDYMTSVAQACTSTQFGNGVGGESGAGVSPVASTTRNLWFRLHTPDVLTDPGAHTATVTLAVQ